MFSQHLLKNGCWSLLSVTEGRVAARPCSTSTGEAMQAGCRMVSLFSPMCHSVPFYFRAAQLTVRHYPGQKDLFRLKWPNHLAERRKFGRLWSITFSLVVCRLSSGERPVLLQFLVYPSFLSTLSTIIMKISSSPGPKAIGLYLGKIQSYSTWARSISEYHFHICQFRT